MKTPRIAVLSALAALTCAGASPAAAAKKEPKDPVLVTVNGVDIRRSEVSDRVFKQFGTAMLNAMADEVIEAQESKRLGVQIDAAEVTARLKRIRAQFPDEKTFQDRLTASGTSLKELKARIERQVLQQGLVLKAKDLAVTEAETEAFFKANQDRLGAPEALRLRHLLVSSEKEANDFLTAIRAGADFAKMASQLSLDPGTKDRGGDMGFVSRGMLQPEIEKAAFASKPGEVGGPVKTSLGWHLFKTEESRAAKPAVYAEIKTELRDALLADKATQAWPVLQKELRDRAKFVTPAAKP